MLSVPEILIRLVGEALRWWRLSFRSTRSIRAENLSVRRQLALYVELGIKPRRIDRATRIPPAILSRFFNWRDALVIVHSATVSRRRHRAGWKLFWRWKSRPDRPRDDLRWSIFLRLHAHGIIARDFLVAVTAHPSPACTPQQLREAAEFEWRYEYLLQVRDNIFAEHLDESVQRLGITVLQSPPHCPKNNAIRERNIGTIRRECLDWSIPPSESHLRSILKSWVPHYNIAHAQITLGPGVPDPPPAYRDYQESRSRHHREESYAVHAKSILAGLLTNILSQPFVRD